MTVATRLLLGTACAIAASNVAVAADLPTRKAAPVDYVRVCDFETCARVFPYGP